MVRMCVSSHPAGATVRARLFHRMANGWRSQLTLTTLAMIMVARFTSSVSTAQTCADSQITAIVIINRAGDHESTTSLSDLRSARRIIHNVPHNEVDLDLSTGP